MGWGPYGVLLIAGYVTGSAGALPYNSLKLTRRARPWGGAPGPPACVRIGSELPASAGQLSSRPLGSPGLDCPADDARIELSRQSFRGLAAKPYSRECGFCY